VCLYVYLSVRERGLNSSGSRWGPVAHSYGNELSSSINGTELLDNLRNFYFIKKGSAPLGCLMNYGHNLASVLSQRTEWIWIKSNVGRLLYTGGGGHFVFISRRLNMSTALFKI
jgi:hypothetical protein